MKKLTTLILLIPFFSFTQNNYNLALIGEYSWPDSEGSDIWGWVDPDDGFEYALIGLNDGFSCVNISDPNNPLEEFYISDLNSTWRDIKTWGNYAYVTTEADAGLLIVDLTDMSGSTFWHVNVFTNPLDGTSVEFTAAHNIYIDENGVAYIFGASSNTGTSPSDGVIFLDVNSNPIAPHYLGSWDDQYIHDGMARGDTLYAGCIYVGELYIIDVSDKNNPITIGTHPTPNLFTHNAWVSDDGQFVFTTDEQSDSYIGAYDISDMSNIQEVDRIQSNPGSNSIPHNTHVDGDFLVTSWYRDGTTVHDITFPNNIVQVAYYDSYAGAGNGFDGCWGTYPFFPSGLIISSDINSSFNQSGKLLIYERSFSQACYLQGTVIDVLTSLPISGVDIEILNTTLSNNTSSNLSGVYFTGTADAANYDVVFSKPGYLSDTLPISLINGNVSVLNVSLQPLVSFSLNGIILDTDGMPIPNADVLIFNNDFTFSTNSDINGNFIINSIFPGNHQVVVGKWGYITSCSTDYVDNSSQVIITLQEGYYDDFSFDFGWSVSGIIAQSSDGMWERGYPEGTYDQGNQYNPEGDVVGDCTDFAYVTGLSSGSQTGSYDVDEANTVLISPIFDLSTNDNYYLSYYSWFQNGFPWGGSANDSLIISISNGNNIVVLETITANSNDLGQWNISAFDLAQYIPLTSSMQLIIETADWDSGQNSQHWVEAGFDRFQITSSITSFEEEVTTSKKLINIVDVLGRKVKKDDYKSPLFYIYDNGNTEKKMKIYLR